MTKEKEECVKDTKKHIANVGKYMIAMSEGIKFRASNHDSSKLDAPELEVFAIYGPKLKGSTYGSDEYKGFLKEMKVALDHHYSNNRHHPEFHKKGIKGMNLLDLIEMICDWKAASERHSNGNIITSIESNKKRFDMSDELTQILLNTDKIL